MLPRAACGVLLSAAVAGFASVAGAQQSLLHIRHRGNPLAATDEAAFPLPSRFHQVADPTAPSGVRSCYPKHVIAAPLGGRQVDFSAFNFADGHPPSAPLLVHFGADVDQRFLVDQHHIADSMAPGAPIALFDLESGERVPILTEMDRNLRSAAHRGRHALIIRPMRPMAMGVRHLAVLTNALRDPGGAPLPIADGFRALRDRIPTDHAELEAARPDYERYFELLAAHGYRRESLALAFDFMVASRDVVTGGIVSMCDQALARAAEAPLDYTIDKVVKAPNTHVALLVEGSFEAPLFLRRDNSIERRPDGTAVLQEETEYYPFTMVVPPQVASGAKLPLVLFGHGIFGSGRRYLAGNLGRSRIQPLAHRGGAVLLATDFIGLCRSDRMLLAGSLLRDLNQLYVLTNRLQQSLVNNLILVETALGALQRDERLDRGGVPFLDPDRVYYYGVSLGGTQGVPLVALSKRITRAFLAVPGGAWATMLTRSIVFKPFKAIFDHLYPDPLLQQAFVTLMQARFDGCDGANMGPLLRRRAPPDAPADRRMVLLEAIGDCQVPNLATRIVARAIGALQLAPAVEPVFGLSTVSHPTTQPVLSQVLVEDALDGYRPPEANVLPERDNGTHSRSVMLEPALRQLLLLLESGETGG